MSTPRRCPHCKGDGWVLDFEGAIDVCDCCCGDGLDPDRLRLVGLDASIRRAVAVAPVCRHENPEQCVVLCPTFDRWGGR